MERPGRLRNWIEAVSALGVIAGLVLVAWELRQSTDQAILNTRATQVSAYQDLMAQISELNRMEIENPEFADLEARFFSGDTTLTARERSQVTSFVWLLFRHGDMAFYQFERGVLERERLQSALGPLLFRLGTPRMRGEWERRRAAFVPSYQMFMDSLFEEGGLEWESP